MKRTLRLSLVAALLAFVCAPSTVANAQVIVNGGFESGFTGWTRVDQVGSDGTFLLQTGTASPVNGDPVPAPPEGTTAAMTDAQGPGSHLLYQDFTLGSIGFASANLSFSLFVGNRADAFVTPSTLDFATPELNQQGRVDIITTLADPFSVAAGDVLLNAYQTQVGDPLVSGYTNIVVDVTSLFNAHLGQTLRLRFAEVDNVFIFQLGVDNVGLSAQVVPEPSFLFAGALPVLGFAWRLRRRQGSA
jgi:hypothetical protein